MTRKDFELIARVLKSQQHAPWHVGACKAFADALTGTNAGFDRARFLKACGVAP